MVFFENLQVAILAVGVIINFRLYCQRAEAAFFSISAVFAVCVLRELSWGRVFFTTGVITVTGPEFIRMRELPYYEFINVALGILIISVVVSLLLTFPWRKFFYEITIPHKYLIVMLLSLGLAYVGEHTLLFPEVQGMLIEEMAEVMLYFWVNNLAIYYYWELEKYKMSASVQLSSDIYNLLS